MVAFFYLLENESSDILQSLYYDNIILQSAQIITQL